MSESWRKIDCPHCELNLSVVLRNGQSFRWKEESKINVSDVGHTWIGVMQNRIWRLRQNNDSHFEFIVVGRFSENENVPEHKRSEHDVQTIRDYFQLDKVSLVSLYEHWTEKDEVFRNLLSTPDSKRQFEGIRVLRQDPVECLFSFICSQNNNIQRISGMIDKLCTAFGERCVRETGDEIFYDFPELHRLAEQDVSDKLKVLGFGYRAAYVNQAAKKIQNDFGGKDWLLKLRNKTYAEAKQELLSLPGVGPKVADCVLLMSLDKLDVVPVDTHVLQVTARHYLPKLKHKSLTEKIHAEIGQFYKEKFGDYAGYAQSVLFSSELKRFASPSTKTEVKDTKSSVKRKRKK